MYYANYMSLYIIQWIAVALEDFPIPCKVSCPYTYFVCTWARDFAKNGKIIFQCNFVSQAEPDPRKRGGSGILHLF